ncbi:glycosyl transferase family 2 [Nitrosococcus halophilus Nc 4]|uniref:Glycosyl transferase family 2 n=1 Tax=Nitrosococcus halophilus (strain Nc4) TaxID=472759 RepID=D5C0P6_NITHN|nr:glycosyltransferase family 2 protein [Nitrosococcus halophilus]ADE16369.1 glycosyl transferase family 2 [Nitrosococcus halophilus Nc 4]
MDLSVIVPLYNEEDSVIPLYKALVNTLNPLNLNYEILFIDDGSRDKTYSLAKELAKNNQLLRVIKFRRNYGQTPAMVAGIEHAKGTILITMDGDLQNDPADIPNFIGKIKEGYDIVVGWRYKRQDKLLTRKIPSKVANWLIGKITGVRIKDNGCSLKAYRGDIIKNIPLYSEMHRFIPAIASLAGVSVAEIKVNHHARQYGISKYGLSRIYKVLIDLITIKTIISFFPRPLVPFSLIAAVAALVSFFSFISGIFHTLQFGQESIVFWGLTILYGGLAIVLLFWGVLAELVYRTGNLKIEIFANLNADNEMSRNSEMEKR